VGAAVRFDAVGRPNRLDARAADAGRTEAGRGADGHELDELIWRIEHDVAEGQTRAVAKYGGPVEATNNVPALEQWYGGTVGVSIDDPGRAYVDATATYVIRFPEATVRTRARLNIQSDADAYTVRLELDAGEGEDVGWSRRWDRRIERDLQ
jgi:hypothetical protein